MAFIVNTSRHPTAVQNVVCGYFLGDGVRYVAVSQVSRLLLYRTMEAHSSSSSSPPPPKWTGEVRDAMECVLESSLFATLKYLEVVPIVNPGTRLVERHLLFMFSIKQMFSIVAVVPSSDTDSLHGWPVKMVTLYHGAVSSTFYQYHFNGVSLCCATGRDVVGPAYISPFGVIPPPYVFLSVHHGVVYIVDVAACVMAGQQGPARGSRTRGSATSVSDVPLSRLFSPETIRAVFEPRRDKAISSVGYFAEAEVDVRHLTVAWRSGERSTALSVYVLYADKRGRAHVSEYVVDTQAERAEASSAVLQALGYPDPADGKGVFWRRKGMIQSDVNADSCLLQCTENGLCVVSPAQVTYVCLRQTKWPTITSCLPHQRTASGAAAQVEPIASILVSTSRFVVFSTAGSVYSVDERLMEDTMEGMAPVVTGRTRDVNDIVIAPLVADMDTVPRCACAAGGNRFVVGSHFARSVVIDVSSGLCATLVDHTGPVLDVAVVRSAVRMSAVTATGFEKSGAISLMRSAVSVRDEVALEGMVGLTGVFQASEVLLLSFPSYTRSLRITSRGAHRAAEASPRHGEEATPGSAGLTAQWLVEEMDTSPFIEDEQTIFLCSTGGLRRSTAVRDRVKARSGSRAERRRRVESCEDLATARCDTELVLFQVTRSRVLSVQGNCRRHIWAPTPAAGGDVSGTATPFLSHATQTPAGHLILSTGTNVISFILDAQLRRFSTLPVVSEPSAIAATTPTHSVGAADVVAVGLWSRSVVFGTCSGGALGPETLTVPTEAVPLSMAFASETRFAQNRQVLVVGFSDGCVGTFGTACGGDRCAWSPIHLLSLTTTPVRVHALLSGNAVLCSGTLPLVLMLREDGLQVTGVSMPEVSVFAALRIPEFPPYALLCGSDHTLRFGHIDTIHKLNRTSLTVGYTVTKLTFLSEWGIFAAAIRQRDRDEIVLFRASHVEQPWRFTPGGTGATVASNSLPLLENERCTFIEAVVVGAASNSPAHEVTAEELNSVTPPQAWRAIGQGTSHEHPSTGVVGDDDVTFQVVLLGMSFIFPEEPQARSSRIMWCGVEEPEAEADTPRLIHRGERDISGALQCCCMVPHSTGRVALGINGSVLLLRWSVGDRTFNVEESICVGLVVTRLLPVNALYGEEDSAVIIACDAQHSVTVLSVNALQGSFTVVGRDVQRRSVMDAVLLPHHRQQEALCRTGELAEGENAVGGDAPSPVVKRVVIGSSLVGHLCCLADDLFNIAVLEQVVREEGSEEEAGGRPPAAADVGGPEPEGDPSRTATAVAPPPPSSVLVAQKRLVTCGQMHVGDLITSLSIGSFAACCGSKSGQANPMKLIPGIRGAQVIYGTSQGGLGTITPVTEETFFFYSIIEVSLLRVVKPVAGFDHASFREVLAIGAERGANRNASYAHAEHSEMKRFFAERQRELKRRAFCDGDVVERFLLLSAKNQLEVTQLANGALRQLVIAAQAMGSIGAALQRSLQGVEDLLVPVTASGASDTSDFESGDSLTEEFQTLLAHVGLPGLPLTVESVQSAVSNLCRIH